jgi:hypothetical protein
LITALAVTETSFAQTTSTGNGTSQARCDFLRLADELGLGQRLAYFHAGREHEGIGNTSTRDQSVDLFCEGAQDRKLG